LDLNSRQAALKQFLARAVDGNNDERISA